MNFKEKQDYAYQMNQQSMKGRLGLVNLLMQSAGLDIDSAVENAQHACYFTTTLEKYMFADLNLASDVEISEFLFKNKYFLANEGCYQKIPSKETMYDLAAQGLIRPDLSFIDVDYRYTGMTRSKVYTELVERLREHPGSNIRVSFVTNPKYIGTEHESKHDHAIIVTTDDDGNFRLCDTSYRPKDLPDNNMVNWITPKNIRWFTAVV